MHALGILAEALRYPDGTWADRLRAAATACEPLAGTAAAGLRGLADLAESLPLGEQEERFTRTFDLNPDCALDVGWHLYGEDYKRGAFLVRMRGLLARCGIAESGELADHLTHLLPLLAALPDDEAAELATGYVLPAVEKMRANFHDKDNPLGALCEATEDVLIALFAREPEVSTA